MTKDKGLNCKYIISANPRNTPVTERAIPVAIFSADESVKRFFLRKWLKADPSDMDPRTVVDWDYYLERLGSVIQKLITIPAALQKVRNPVPRVAHPDWLQKRITAKDDKFKQKKINDLFTRQPLIERSVNLLDHRLPATCDIEDALSSQLKSPTRSAKLTKRKATETTDQPLVDAFASHPSDAPTIDEDYGIWLQYQKKKWKMQKQARIRRRQLFGERPNVATDSISGFFRNQAELTYIKTWHLLQLRQGESPGEVTAFVLIGKKIQSLDIKVPRTLYLNLKGEDLPNVEIPGCDVEKVAHVPAKRPRLCTLIQVDDARSYLFARS